MKNYLIKNALLSILFLMTSIVGVLGQTTEFKKYVCDTQGNNTVDLALDVIGNGFSAESGRWDLVTNDVTTIADYTPSKVLTEDVSNVFVLSGKLPGIYTFVFTATGTSACIGVGQRRLAKVVILETPKNQSSGIMLCPNTTGTIDLSTILSATFPLNTFKDVSNGGTLSGTTLTINKDFKGFLTVKYDRTYTTEEQKVGCNTEATVMINVLRDDTPPTAKNSSTISYCAKEVPTELNLNSLITHTATGGTWSVEKTTGSGIAPDLSGQKVNFDKTKWQIGDTYKFTYAYNNLNECYNNGSLTINISIKDDLAADFVDKTKEICKNSAPNMVFDILRDGFDINIPLSAGTLKTIEQITSIDVSDGLFEVENVRIGTYKYTFTVSEAADICNLSGKEATLTLKVIDPSATQDGRIEFCMADLESRTGDVTLSHLISGLPNTGVTWTAKSTSLGNVSGGTLPYLNLKNAGLGTYLLNYSYDAGGCGKSKGNLYLTVTEKLDMNNKEISYCRSDMPTPIHLSQALGVDVDGTWTITNNPNNTGVLSTTTFSEKDSTTGDKEYVLTFTPTKTDCEAKAITLTIRVSDSSF